MTVQALCVLVLLAMVGISDSAYCICNSSLNDTVLQRNIDYACGNGADCSPILQNGACFLPNTVKDHCNYAVNSYYRRKNEAPGSCEFSGTAFTSTNVPNAAPGCVYPSSPGGGSNPTPPSFPGGPPSFPGGPPSPPGFNFTPPGPFPGSFVPPGGFNGNGVYSQFSNKSMFVMFFSFFIYGLIWLIL